MGEAETTAAGVTLPIVNVACLAPITQALMQSKRVNAALTVPDCTIEGWYDSRRDAVDKSAREVAHALQTFGFMYITDYGIDAALERRLDAHARGFFRLPDAEKASISMGRGGLAWRGYFPVGGELTSGKPDIKEGLYYGQERTAEDPRVRSRTPLFGSNLHPKEPKALAPAVVAYMDICEALGQGLLMLIAISLGLQPSYFIRSFCADPTCLFRIFHYPPPQILTDPALRDASLWGVGAHTDYGLLTLLKQDNVGGLEVRCAADGAWIAAPPIEGTLVVNIGDMMEAMTAGLFTSTLHRVRNRGGPDAMRLSFPFFFDPGFHSEVHELPLTPELQAAAKHAVNARHRTNQVRWDDAKGAVTVRVSGTYGAYLLSKVGKVFPQLAAVHHQQLDAKL